MVQAQAGLCLASKRRLQVGDLTEPVGMDVERNAYLDYAS